MHELLHFVGFCGDHFSHINLIDFMLIVYTHPGYFAQTFFSIFNFVKNMFRL